jgi:hypothetical protein
MTRGLAAAGVVLAMAAGPAAAADVRETARGLLDKHAGAIVTVKLVLKRRMVVQGQERGSTETQAEILGTVISPSGLTLVADSDSNPFGMFMSDGDGPKVDTDTSDVKILLPDGREIPSRFVLRDRDLDLAFLIPEAADEKLPYLDIEAAAAPVPKPLDDLIFLYRVAKNLNREACVRQAPVLTVVRKPRTFILSEWMSSLAALGGPAVDAQGTLLGFVVLRRSPGAMAEARARGPIRGAFDMFTPVVLTLADVKTVADEARKAAAKPAQP